MTGDRITKVQRWLDLIAFLLGRRRPATVDEVFDAVPAYGGRGDADGGTASDSARRMFERDKDELRKLGIAIHTERFATSYGTESGDGYVLRSEDFFVPYLRLIDEGRAGSSGSTRPEGGRRPPDELAFKRGEAELILVALAEAGDVPGSPLAGATRRALRKLGFDLGRESEPDDLATGVFLPGRGEVAAVARRISEALMQRRRIRFRYHGAARGGVTERDVAPYGLLMESGAWYVVGHDALRDDLRMFHLGRMVDLETDEEASSAYDIPGDFDIAAFRDGWTAGPTAEADDAWVVDLRFDGPRARWAERNGYGESVEADGAGGNVRRFVVRDRGPFCDWVLGLGGDVHVVRPDNVATEVADRAARVTEMHTGEVSAAGAGRDG